MAWGTVELEPEVTAWLEGLSDDAFGQAAFYIDLLAEYGVSLGEPYTRQLRGKLRELRFFLSRDRIRMSYFIATGRRIILLSVFKKTQRREQRKLTERSAR
jgi:hypothetical protein